MRKPADFVDSAHVELQECSDRPRRIHHGARFLDGKPACVPVPADDAIHIRTGRVWLHRKECHVVFVLRIPIPRADGININSAADFEDHRPAAARVGHVTV
ncbi:MAG TPA: hypothetical protein PK472_05260, partial [Pseudomonadota bacterium]|nr:hypothetical protein [Pseudomonadota bacterium]